VLVIVSSWSVSQITPLWTPRNLIIVDPAIRMALALLVVSASRSRWIRTLLSSTLIVLLTLGLGTVASANRNPWKTDFRDAVKLVVTTRKYHPGVQIAGDVSPWWAFGNAAHPKDPRLVKQLTADHHVSRETFPDGVHLHGHDVLWLMYLGPSSSNAANSRIMVNAASPTQCRPIDITGILAMYCTARK